jgi:hypothetical protein
MARLLPRLRADPERFLFGNFDNKHLTHTGLLNLGPVRFVANRCYVKCGGVA